MRKIKGINVNNSSLRFNPFPLLLSFLGPNDRRHNNKLMMMRMRVPILETTKLG
jgi:hypothetical protein